MKLAAILFISLHLGVHSERILAVFPTLWHNHYGLGSTMLKGLAKEGHEVTMMSPFFEPLVPENFTYDDIILKELQDDKEKMKKKYDTLANIDANIFTRTRLIADMMLEWSEKLFRHPRAKKFLSSGDTFDVVIVEDYLNPVHRAIAAQFGAPLIVFSTLGPNVWVNRITGNPSPPSYIPDAFTGFSFKMGLLDRLVNSFVYLYQELFYHYYVLPKNEELRKKYLPNTPPLTEVIYNTSLVLLYSNPVIHQPVPLVPNVIEVAGYHIRPPALISMDVKEFMNEGYYGIVYMYLGPDVHTTDLSTELLKTFINVFGELKQRVMWRIEDPDIAERIGMEIPSNIMMRRWFPQVDILGQGNIRLFITNCDLPAVTEAVAREIPILAIPLLGDQFLNAQYVVDQKYGASLQFKDITEKSFKRKIHEVIFKRKYERNIKRASTLFNDTLESPMNTTKYWVEYVIRHKGASHLKVAALDLSWCKYLLLDVITVAVLPILILYYFIIKKLRTKFCSRKKEKDTKEKNKDKKEKQN